RNVTADWPAKLRMRLSTDSVNVRMRNSGSATIGLGVRDSIRTKAASEQAATANNASIGGDIHPHAWPRFTASTIVLSVKKIATAPGMSSRRSLLARSSL